MASSPIYNIAVADDGMMKKYAKVAAGTNGAGNIEYVGKALPGSLTSSRAWQIQKWSYDSTGFLTDINYCNGTGDFRFAWDDRANLPFS